MRVLIGYSMRSGSTLLQHILNGHSMIKAYSDLSSALGLISVLAGATAGTRICIKPPDLLYLQSSLDFYRHFDRFIWLARDPRDSYLSSIESGYAYWFWRKGRRRHGVDLGLLRRWQRVYRHYWAYPERWHLVHYEDLASDPYNNIAGLLSYLELPQERLLPFGRFGRLHGGDYKIAGSTQVNPRSARRYMRELDGRQRAVFAEVLGQQMALLGYS